MPPEQTPTQPEGAVPAEPPTNPVPPPNNFSAQLNPVGQEKVKTYQTAGILVLIFCSLPLGAVILYYAGKVKSSLQAGDVEAAKKASRTAKILTIVGVAIGLPLSILYVVAQIHK